MIITILKKMNQVCVVWIDIAKKLQGFLIRYTNGLAKAVGPKYYLTLGHLF